MAMRKNKEPLAGEMHREVVRRAEAVERIYKMMREAGITAWYDEPGVPLHSIVEFGELLFDCDHGKVTVIP